MRLMGLWRKDGNGPHNFRLEWNLHLEYRISQIYLGLIFSYFQLNCYGLRQMAQFYSQQNNT